MCRCNFTGESYESFFIQMYVHEEYEHTLVN